MAYLAERLACFAYAFEATTLIRLRSLRCLFAECFHRLGYRYALHRRDLPGAPDVVFSGSSKDHPRARLFLASTQGVRRWKSSEVAGRLLEAEIAWQH